jgi:hypothetical protein
MGLTQGAREASRDRHRSRTGIVCLDLTSVNEKLRRHYAQYSFKWLALPPATEHAKMAEIDAPAEQSAANADYIDGISGPVAIFPHRLL